VEVLQKTVFPHQHDLRMVPAGVEMIDADIAIGMPPQDATRPREFPHLTRVRAADHFEICHGFTIVSTDHPSE
jgi:hypothetical protein